MNIAEQCGTCVHFEWCSRAYGKYHIYRAMGWRPEWKPDDGTKHPIPGCRWRVPKDGADGAKASQ